MRVRAFLLAALVMGLLPASAAADYPHVVEPGETLTSVAATDGLSVDAIAAANGVSPEAQLVIGQILYIPPQSADTSALTQSATTGQTTAGSTEQASDTDTAAAPDTAAQQTSHASASSSPEPTAEFASSAEIADVADQYGVPASLAEAVAWQESGWNNNEVSGVGAVGVMQIVPTTWNWIDRYLTPSAPLGTASASENIRAGVLLLHQLLAETGDNVSLAVAGYYQGIASVQAYGMYPNTQQYVADVLALQQRFGG